MFGRHKATNPDPKASAQAALAALKVLMDEGEALSKTGTKTTATVQSVELTATLSETGTRLFDTTVQVDSDGGPYAAVVPMYLMGRGADLPAVGEVIEIYVDPAERTRARATLTWRTKYRAPERRLRWKVPEECPNCGAPVDQAGASQSEHPTCRQCRQPLPAEPLVVSD